jgi:2,3-bisphosphoglycerate-dependent phosphoglycerate mutase
MAMITEMVLARHGEAHCNLTGMAGGERTCTGLTDRGRQQMRALGAHLREEQESGPPFDVLYASPRRRVRESAEILAAALGLPAHVEPGLAGPRHGDADGRRWEDIKAAFGGPPQSDPDRRYAPGSETWNEYLARATACLAELTQRHAGRRVLITGHAETVQAAFTLMLALPAGSSARAGFATDHASVTRWHMRRNRFGQEVWLLTAFNDTRHLAGIS